jgi:hypothetical protein
MIPLPMFHYAICALFDNLLPYETEEDKAVRHILLLWPFDFKHIPFCHQEQANMLEQAFSEATIKPSVASAAFAIAKLPKLFGKKSRFFPVYVLAVDLVKKTENLIGALRSLQEHARYSILPPELRQPFAEAAREYTKALCYYRCKEEGHLEDLRAAVLARIPYLRPLLWQDQISLEEKDTLTREWDRIKATYYVLYGVPLSDLEIARLICDSYGSLF